MSEAFKNDRRAQPAHQTGRAGGVTDREEQPIALCHSHFMRHHLQRTGLDGDEDEVSLFKRLSQRLNCLVVPVGDNSRLGLQPVPQSLVQAGCFMINIV